MSTETVIDSHVHVWRAAEVDVPPVMTGDHGTRDYTVDDLKQTLASVGISRAVFVGVGGPIGIRKTVEAMDQSDVIIAAVGSLDLEDDARTKILLDSDIPTQRMSGFRHLVQRHETGTFLSSEAARRSLEALAAKDKVFEIMPAGLADVKRLAEIAREHPNMRVVLDHLAKPIGGPGDEEWRIAMKHVVDLPNCFVKVSGWTTPVRETWGANELRPYFEWVLENIGADRLLYGSNWPVTLVAGSYERMWSETLAAIDGCTPEERQLLLHKTAARVYACGSEDA